MPEYTPTTRDVRAVWCTFSEYGGLVDRPHSGLWDDRLAEFDRWLAGRDKEVAARAWSEGMRIMAGQTGAGDRIESLNPYRSGGTQ